MMANNNKLISTDKAHFPIPLLQLLFLQQVDYGLSSTI